MSTDLKYRTESHLLATIAYEKRRMNTAKLRIQWAELELKRRAELPAKEKSND